MFSTGEHRSPEDPMHSAENLHVESDFNHCIDAGASQSWHHSHTRENDIERINYSENEIRMQPWVRLETSEVWYLSERIEPAIKA